MKRLISLLLCLTFCMAFAACGQENTEPPRTIYVGKICLTLPSGWVETMESDQMTFTFKDSSNKAMGKLVIGSQAVEAPAAVTDFKEAQPAKNGEGFQQAIQIITGTAQDGSPVTEYHLIHQKRDYVFIFTAGVEEAVIRQILDSIELQ